MDDIAVQKSRGSKRKRGGYGCFFLFSLFFLVIGSIPALLNHSVLQTRFTGMQTTALATIDAVCGEDYEDRSYFYYYIFTFTDSYGKVYQVTNTSVCSNGIVSDGEHITIWYQPNDPTQFITANDLTFDSVFFAGFSIPMLLCIILFSVSLFRGRFVRERK